MSLRLAVVPLVGLGLMAVGGVHSASVGPAGGAAPGRLTWPLSQWVLTQPYGCTAVELEPVAAWCPAGHFHSGIDLAAPVVTPVHAAADGVARVAESPGGYGLYVVVDHGGGVATLYGHLEWTSLRSGEHIRAGENLGLLGSSGLSTGPHLHFEVRRDGRPVDPIAWLPAVR